MYFDPKKKKKKNKKRKIIIEGIQILKYQNIILAVLKHISEREHYFKMISSLEHVQNVGV